MKFFILSWFVIAFGAAKANSNFVSPYTSRLCNFDAVGAAEQAAKALNTFGYQLYKRIVNENPSKNIVFSPASISLGLALLESGASGTTLQELQKALMPPGSNELDSSNLYQTLQNELRANNENGFKVNIANALFYNQGLQLKSEYSGKIKLCFTTDIMAAPFGRDYEAARIQINKWVSDATYSKIPELFKPGSITPGEVAVIANALYFKGEWLDRFTTTEDGNFYRFGNSNDIQKIKFLTRNDIYQYTTTRYAKIVKIPYRDNLFAMYIILPIERNEVAKVEPSLTALSTLLEFRNYQVDLKLPKFTTRLSFDLRKILEQAGQKEIFTDQANFSRLSDSPLKVSGAVHEAYIKVTENGTEAAAASAYEMPLTMGLAEGDASFIADHPFVFAIVHEPTKAIMFEGRINFVENSAQGPPPPLDFLK